MSKHDSTVRGIRKRRKNKNYTNVLEGSRGILLAISEGLNVYGIPHNLYLPDGSNQGFIEPPKGNKHKQRFNGLIKKIEKEYPDLFK